MISKDKQYRTRSGYEVRIYATDGTYPNVVHGAYLGEHGWAACLWLNSGSAKEGYLRSYDLVEIKPRQKMMTDHLVTRLRDEAEEKYFTHPSNLLRAAADRIEQLEAALRKINNRLNDKDSWLAQSIDAREIAEAAMKGNNGGQDRQSD